MTLCINDNAFLLSANLFETHGHQEDVQKVSNIGSMVKVRDNKNHGVVLLSNMSEGIKLFVLRIRLVVSHINTKFFFKCNSKDGFDIAED